MKTHSFFSRHFRLLALAAALFLCASPAKAYITVTAYWKMGEADTNASAGASAVTAVDSIGTNYLAYTGAANYSANFPTSTVPTTLSVNFSGAAYALGSPASTVNNNFGIEAWVKPATNGTTAMILYNGNTAASGWGFYLEPSTNSYVGIFGGVAVLSTPANTAPTNVWADVALVRQSGTTTLYVNGVAKATSAATPNTPTGNFAIGTAPQSPGAQTFSGLVDEARVFTFIAGQFSTGDLFTNTTLSLSTYQLFEPAAAGNDGFQVRATVSWLLVTGGSWLHPSVSGGSGNLVVTFTCDANPGPTRRGTMQVGNQLLTVIQAGSTYVTASVPKRTLISGFPTEPVDVVLDSAGNAYYIDFGRKSLRVWSSASQSVSTLVSGLQSPEGLGIDNAGNIYIGDYVSGLQKWTAPGGPFTTVVSSRQSAGAAVNASGNIYFSDLNFNTVDTLNGAFIDTMPFPAFTMPWSVRTDFIGNVYASDANGNKLAKWTAALNTAATFLSTGLNKPNGLAVDWAGNVFIADNGSGQIKKWAANGGAVTSPITGLNHPGGVAIDKWGNFFVADSQNDALVEFPRALVDTASRTETASPGTDALNPVLPGGFDLNLYPPSSDSAWLTIAGTANQTVTFNFEGNPGASRTGHITLLGQSIAITQSPANYVLGTTNLVEGPAAGTDSVLLVITPGGVPWTATANAPWLSVVTPNGVGSSNVVFNLEGNSGPSRTGTITAAGRTVTVTQAGTNYVRAPGKYDIQTIVFKSGGIVVDPSGNVFFSDPAGNKVYRRTSSNTTAIVTSGLSQPRGVARDNAGNIYIADTSNNAIKEWVAASSTVITLVSTGLSGPRGVAVDGAGNVYIADTTNNLVKEWIAASNTVVTLASGITRDQAIAVDVAGNAYFTSFVSSGTMHKRDAVTGNVTTLFNPRFPSSVAVDGSGNVFYFDALAPSIKKWSAATGGQTVVVPLANGLNIVALAVDTAGNIYASDDDTVHIFESLNAFVNPTAHSEGPLGGQDALSPVAPTNTSLTGSFTPTSDQPWLTITTVTNGIVSFSFPPLGTNRTAHINLLGQSITITQSGFIATFGTTNLLEGPGAGTDSVVFGLFPSVAAWNATTTNSWLHISNSAGTGSATLVFNFDPNPGATRTGSISNLNQIITITQAGSNYVSAGTWTSLIASNVSSPAGVAVDAAGNVYYSDTNNSTVREWIQSSNQIVAIVPSGLLQPLGIAIDTASNIYIADSQHNAIKKWNAASNTVTTLVSAGLSNPNAVAVDVSGNVFIADSGNSAVKEWVAASNTVTTLVPGITGLVGVAVDAAGNVYIASRLGTPLSEWIQSTNNLVSIATPGLTEARSVSVDGSGNIYIPDKNGTIYTLTGGTHTPGILTLPGFANPAAAVVDATENLYVADQGNQVVYELPHAFAVPASFSPSAAAGTINLPAILPPTQQLLAPFVPTVDQLWLVISNIQAGVVTVSYADNFNSASRTGHVSVLNQIYTFTEQGMSITPALTNLLEGPSAGADSIIIASAPFNNPWTADPPLNAPWLHVTSTSGLAPTNFSFYFDANPGPTRTGSFNFSGQTITVTQAGSTYVPAEYSTLVPESSPTNYIIAMATDRAGNVYFTDTRKGLYKWNAANYSLSFLTTLPTNILYASSLTADPSGNVVVAGYQFIVEWFADGGTMQVVRTNDLFGPGYQAVAADQAGNFYVLDYYGYFTKWSPDWTSSKNITALYSYASEMPEDFAGNLYLGGDGIVVSELLANGGSLITIPAPDISPNTYVDGKGNLYSAFDGLHMNKRIWANANTIIFGTNVAYNLAAVNFSGDVFYSSNRDVRVIPNAFVDATSKLESASAGTDTLPVALSQNLTLAAPFTPVSDQPWLTITGVDSGVTSFAFTANTNAGSRTAHITLFGKSITVTQLAIPKLINPTMTTNGVFQIGITNVDSNSIITVLTSTNVSLPFSNWTVLGAPSNVAPGLKQFTDTNATDPVRFYNVRSP